MTHRTLRQQSAESDVVGHVGNVCNACLAISDVSSDIAGNAGTFHGFDCVW
jgi:hypothetical protein